MEILHGGLLWLEEPISIDIELIAFITCLSSMGESPTQYLDNKTKEKTRERDEEDIRDGKRLTQNYYQEN
jgi:hypothetical protein